MASDTSQPAPTALRDSKSAPPDPALLEAFMGKMLVEMGAGWSAVLGLLGDRLGLYKALAHRGPSTSAELAAAAGVAERHTREWLNAQAAADYVSYDKASGRFYLSPEQAMVFAEEGSPTFMCGGFEMLASVFLDEPRIEEAFRTGGGVGWHEHHDCLFRGTERFFRTSYNANLIGNWIPALEGVEARLREGAKVADIGCGHGASTVLMAKAFPNSRFYGFDYHPASIERARALAEEEGVAQRTTFTVASAKDFPAADYDLVTIFDALHDMGDPVGAARHILSTLKPDGAFMLVEPFAHDELTDNFNPVGRIFYSGSTMICTPASLSQEVGLGLGAQAGESRMRKVVQEAGFTRFRRAAETPFNLVFEVRP